MANKIYAVITEETVVGAKGRVLDALDKLTGGEAEKAIKLVSEYVELESILEEHYKDKAQGVA